jgi:hypothetical protein
MECHSLRGVWNPYPIFFPVIPVLHRFPGQCSLAYSALACFRMGTSGSAFFQSLKNSW